MIEVENPFIHPSYILLIVHSYKVYPLSNIPNRFYLESRKEKPAIVRFYMEPCTVSTLYLSKEVLLGKYKEKTLQGYSLRNKPESP